MSLPLNQVETCMITLRVRSFKQHLYYLEGLSFEMLLKVLVTSLVDIYILMSNFLEIISSYCAQLLFLNVLFLKSRELKSSKKWLSILENL